MFGLKISARERRTVWIGLVVSLLGLTVAYGVVPFARHWQQREQQIAAEAERLARLRGLIAYETQLGDAVQARVGALEAGPQRLLSGRTPALAASALQGLLQDFADRSQVTISRLDVAGAPVTGNGPLPMIPASVSAIGDIYGVTDLLSLIQNGPRLLEITELSVRPNPALRGGLLQVSLTLRGAFVGS